jgi:hypothetical protein
LWLCSSVLHSRGRDFMTELHLGESRVIFVISSILAVTEWCCATALVSNSLLLFLDVSGPVLQQCLFIHQILIL